jgi:plastocyanin
MAAKKNKRAARTRRRWKTSTVLTWVGLGALGTAILVLGFFAFRGGDEPRRAPLRQTPVVSEEAEVTIDVLDDDYEPRHLTVRPGTKVTWRFEGRSEHDVTDGGGAFKSPIQDDGEFTLTFADPGEYRYYCTLHHAMQGTLVVAP